MVNTLFTETEQRFAELTRVPVVDLNLFADYQRQLVKSRLSKMRKTWDEGAVGVVYASCRDDGSLWVLDGQHRVFIGREKGVMEVDCKVYCFLSMEREAQLRRMFNDRQADKPLDRFRLKEGGGNQAALHISEILTRNGFQFKDSGNKGPYDLAGVRSVEEIYASSNGDRLLEETLQVAKVAWGEGSESVTGHVLSAVAMLVKYYRDLLTIPEIGKRLGVYTHGWYKRHDQSNGYVPGRLALIMLDVLNYKRRKRLPNKFIGESETDV